MDTYDDGVYEGPVKTKEVNLAGPSETPKSVFVSVELTARGVRKVTTGITGLWQPSVHSDVA